MLEYITEDTPDTLWAMIYSIPGIGKTRFGLALPEVFGDIVYYAADLASDKLKPVLEHYKTNRDGSRRIHPLKPKGDNPLHNFSEFCIHDWKKDFPKAKTLVVDTYTKVANDCIMWSANNQAVTAEKHFVVGVPGASGTQIIPNRGDYMAIAGLTRGFLNDLQQHQGDMHIIFLMHEDEPTTSDSGSTVGGPAHPGRKMTLELPASFNTVIRLARKVIQVEVNGRKTPKGRVVAHTDNHGQYIARIREGGLKGNPIPQIVLDEDPINGWDEYLKHFMPKEYAQEMALRAGQEKK